MSYSAQRFRSPPRPRKRLTDREVLSFLDQFEKTRDESKTWPLWMQVAAHEASASFAKREG